ncbi:ABC transporter [Paratractidigestivibacter sp.]|uniref:ABC transporter n=1 Tax=Paratractidigestivibacter sp. TaxID=2847316 RepID=UPI002AC8B5F5|nr:ABC transporter [Paratractidigestivibacter sp.]
MNGHDDYAALGLGERKRLLAAFEGLARRLPFSYKVFAYRRSEVSSPEAFIARFKRDLVNFLTDNLEFFQGFDRVKIYYDNGQQMVTSALHGAIDFTLSKDAVLYRLASAQDYRLFQTVDYLCTLELTDVKYREKCLTETDVKVFGADYQAFKKNHLARIRRKAM